MTSATVKAAGKFRKGLLGQQRGYLASFSDGFTTGRLPPAECPVRCEAPAVYPEPLPGGQGGFLIQNTKEKLRKEILAEWS